MIALQKSVKAILSTPLSSDDKLKYITFLVAVADNKKLLSFTAKKLAKELRGIHSSENERLSEEEKTNIKIEEIRSTLKQLAAAQ